MPWKIKKVGTQFCVFDKNDKKLKCYTNSEDAKKYKDTLSSNAGHKLENLEKVMLENGPVVVGVAVTNIPHLPLPPLSVVEDNGEEKVRVPFLRTGIFRHPNGELVFNEAVFDKILQNHGDKKSWYGVSLNEKHKPGAALTWFDSERGGSIVKEYDEKFGHMLVGYGKPTSSRVLEMIKNKEYVFASVELQPNHKSNMIARLSSDDLVEINEDDLVNLANPYHDNLGRFASGAGRAGKSAAKFTGKAAKVGGKAAWSVTKTTAKAVGLATVVGAGVLGAFGVVAVAAGGAVALAGATYLAAIEAEAERSRMPENGESLSEWWSKQDDITEARETKSDIEEFFNSHPSRSD